MVSGSPNSFMSGNDNAAVRETVLISDSDLLPRAKPPVEEGPRVQSNRVSWFVLVALMTFAPLAFGAVEFWSTAIVELLALFLALSWVFGAARQHQIRLQMNSLAWAAMGLQTWVILQLALKRTLDRVDTRESLLLLFSYFSVFIVVSNEGWSLRWIRRLAFGIATIGFAVAAFGIIQSFSWNGHIYWIRRIQEGTPFGPYVNHNHFAGLMEMTFPVSLALVFSRSLEGTWKALLVFFGVVMALATLLSFSRGGIISFAFSLLCFVYLFSLRRGLKRVMRAAGLLVALTVGLLGWLGGEHVQRTLTLEGLTQEASFVDRIHMARDTLEIIRDHPFTGTGLGTFHIAIPLYTTWYSNFTIDKAHNDYLQLLSEVGLIGFAFVVLGIVGLFRSVLVMVKDKTQPFSPLRLGAFCGCLAILIHSLVDFNLQIPANATYFSVLAALATRQLHGRNTTS
jgi:O-antigen ligase